MADAYYWYSSLQKPSDSEILEWVLWQYTHLYNCYMDAKPLIPPRRLVELSFHDLEKDPVAQISSIYKTFGYVIHPLALKKYGRDKQYIG